MRSARKRSASPRHCGYGFPCRPAPGSPPRRRGARLGDELVAVGFGFVDDAALVLAGAGDVLEGVADFLGRVDVLKLDGYDAHADLVAVEDFLQKLRGFRLDLELAVRQRGVDEAVADDFTHGGFRGVFDHGG